MGADVGSAGRVLGSFRGRSGRPEILRPGRGHAGYWPLGGALSLAFSGVLLSVRDAGIVLPIVCAAGSLYGLPLRLDVRVRAWV